VERKGLEQRFFFLQAALPTRVVGVRRHQTRYLNWEAGKGACMTAETGNKFACECTLWRLLCWTRRRGGGDGN